MVRKPDAYGGVEREFPPSPRALSMFALAGIARSRQGVQKRNQRCPALD